MFPLVIFFLVLSQDLNSPYTQDVSIGFYPGAACGAWKHAPIILLPRSDALLQAYPPFLDHPKHPSD